MSPTLSLPRAGDQFQISSTASPEIQHPTVWRNWLFIAYSDERWFCHQFLTRRMYFLALGMKWLTRDHFNLIPGNQLAYKHSMSWEAVRTANRSLTHPPLIDDFTDPLTILTRLENKLFIDYICVNIFSINLNIFFVLLHHVPAQWGVRTGKRHFFKAKSHQTSHWKLCVLPLLVSSLRYFRASTWYERKIGTGEYNG